MQVTNEHSIGRLVADASHDLSTLVRDEIALAKAELKHNVSAAGKGGGMLGAAGFLGLVAFLLLSFAAAYGLVAAGLHEALGFLIVAGVYLLVGGLLALIGIRKVKQAKPPQRTIKSIDEAKTLLNRGGNQEQPTPAELDQRAGT